MYSGQENTLQNAMHTTLQAMPCAPHLAQARTARLSRRVWQEGKSSSLRNVKQDV